MRNTLLRGRAVWRTRGLTEDWKAAGWAGMAGGTFYLFVQMFVRPLFFEGSPLLEARRIAAIVLGRDSLTVWGASDPLPVLIGVVVNFTLSMLYCRGLALAWSRLTRMQAVDLGLLCGLLLYVVNFHWFTAYFPWFAVERDAATMLSNALFGGLAAFVYKTLERRDRWL